MAAASLLSGVTQLKQELAVKSAELGKASEQLKGAREQTAKLQDALHQAALDKKRLSTSLATITEESERLRSTSHVLEKRIAELEAAQVKHDADTAALRVEYASTCTQLALAVVEERRRARQALTAAGVATDAFTTATSDGPAALASGSVLAGSPQLEAAVGTLGRAAEMDATVKAAKDAADALSKDVAALFRDHCAVVQQCADSAALLSFFKTSADERVQELMDEARAFKDLRHKSFIDALTSVASDRLQRAGTLLAGFSAGAAAGAATAAGAGKPASILELALDHTFRFGSLAERVAAGDAGDAAAAAVGAGPEPHLAVPRILYDSLAKQLKLVDTSVAMAAGGIADKSTADITAAGGGGASDRSVLDRSDASGITTTTGAGDSSPSTIGSDATEDSSMGRTEMTAAAV